MKKEQDRGAKILTQTKEEVYQEIAKLNKKKEETHSKINQIINFKKMLNLYERQLVDDIANMDVQQRIKLEVIEKTKYTRKMTEHEIETKWEKFVKESGMEKAIGYKE